MQLMTEPKLEQHRNHHLEAQQQHYHHIDPSQQEQPGELGASINSGSQQHQLIQGDAILNQAQLSQLISQQQQQQQPQQSLNQAGYQQQQQLLHQHAASRLPAQQQQQQQQQLPTNSPPVNNTTSVLAAPLQPPPAPATTMNIQPSSFTKNHLLNNNGANVPLTGRDEDISIKKRREDLSRRPSYRRIFNDLTGLSGPLEPPALLGQLAPPAAPASRQSPQSGPGVNQQQQQQPTSTPSPQALDLLNSAGLQESVATSQSPVSVVDLHTTTPTTQLAQQQQQQLQHHQHPHPHQQHQQQHQHHHSLPTNHLQSQQQQQQQHHHHHHPQQQQPQPQRHHHHHHPQQQQQPQHHHQHQQAPQSHQIHQIQAEAASPPITNVIVNEEATKKRELRLQKNREAAKECRRKKKEYIKCLENRVAVLENQNKALIDELKTLKDLYCKSNTE